MRWEGPRDPRCGARRVTLFQGLEKCETLVLKSLKWVNFSLLEPGSVPRYVKVLWKSVFSNGNRTVPVVFTQIDLKVSIITKSKCF